ncbi:MAG: polyhydroxyalkanoate synthesis regulator DNA-binding domain-containing protein [Bdellovibrionales bacterium]|nr:polyhydroxyalkanoate synthesis regulator DNA-binding domain-containing protein [Bdellovibrionales bacterium]
MKQNTFQPSSNLRPRKKIIKRYGNRKLYDTEQSSYVVLNDIAKMIRNKEEVQVIDNETKNDITLATLTQIIFGAEKKSRVSAPAEVLKTIICEGDGSFSSFLSKMGLFKKTGNSVQKQTTQSASSYNKESGFREKNFKEENSVDQKVATVATSYKMQTNSEKTEDMIPHLPGSHLDK